MKLRSALSGAGVSMLALALAPIPLAAGSASGTNAAHRAQPPPVVITVDPRVELLSILFRFAGNPEYGRGQVALYTTEVEKHFGPFRDHPAVRLARELRQKRGVSYDACMSLAVHLNNVTNLQPLVPLSPWPEGLDRRWTAKDVDRFLEATRRFVDATAYAKFLERERPLYEGTEAALGALLRKEAHLEWFQEFFGERPNAAFIIAPGLLNGGCCYGVHCRNSTTSETLYCILGVWQTNSKGQPEFSRGMLGTVVHEFGHSFANQVIDLHQAELRSAGEKLFGPVAAKMRAQAYGDSQTMLRESLVRACEVRYALRYDGPAAASTVVAYNKGRGFLWTAELSEVLGQYEAHRHDYPTLESFAPRLVAFFTSYAARFGEQQQAPGSQGLVEPGLSRARTTARPQNLPASSPTPAAGV